jgi:hypothetical protein
MLTQDQVAERRGHKIMSYYKSVTKSRKKTSHTFHLLMCLVTCGGWGVVWFLMWAWNTFGPRKRSVTKHRLPEVQHQVVYVPPPPPVSSHLQQQPPFQPPVPPTPPPPHPQTTQGQWTEQKPWF